MNLLRKDYFIKYKIPPFRKFEILVRLLLDQNCIFFKICSNKKHRNNSTCQVFSTHSWHRTHRFLNQTYVFYVNYVLKIFNAFFQYLHVKTILPYAFAAFWAIFEYSLFTIITPTKITIIAPNINHVKCSLANNQPNNTATIVFTYTWIDNLAGEI